jgi:hypothetical protein
MVADGSGDVAAGMAGGLASTVEIVGTGRALL